MVEPELAVVYSPREWANRVVRHVTDHGGGRVRLRVVDGRVALEEEFDVLIAEDVTSFLSSRFVQEVHRRGRCILGVYDLDEPTGRQRLIDLGVDDVIEDTAAAEDFVRRISLIAPRRRPGSAPMREPPAGELDAPPVGRWPRMGNLAVDGALVEMERDLGRLEGGGGTREGAAGGGRGHLWAVGGPPGGCGASEVAVELARALRLSQGASLLMDADEVSPSLAQRLALAPIPNIRSAIDSLFHGTGRLTECLLPVLRGGFPLLGGLANAADWAQVRPDEVAEVASELSLTHPHVVANVSSHVQDLTRAGGGDRFGITRTVLAAADLIVGVGLATPVGVARMVAWLAEVAGLAPGRPIHLVINRAPSAKFVRSEVASEIRRSYAPASLHFAPFDAAVERASWRGELVAAGHFTRAIADLAALAPVRPRPPGQPRSQRRKG